MNPILSRRMEEFEREFLNPDKFSSRGLIHPKYQEGFQGQFIVDIKAFIQDTFQEARTQTIEEMKERAQSEFGHKEYIGRMALMEFFQSLSK